MTRTSNATMSQNALTQYQIELAHEKIRQEEAQFHLGVSTNRINDLTRKIANLTHALHKEPAND